MTPLDDAIMWGVCFHNRRPIALFRTYQRAVEYEKALKKVYGSYVSIVKTLVNYEKCIDEDGGEKP